MPKNKDLKRLVRSRMQKTGESYTAARLQIVKKRMPATAGGADHAARAGMSDDAVRAKTGRDWAEWVRILDAAGASGMPHRDVATYVHDRFGVSGWWAQSVTVGYERIRGLRDVLQTRRGDYAATKSKTFPVPVGALFDAFAVPANRRRWLPGAKVVARSAVPGKSIRFTWTDGLPLQAYFTAKGPGKSQVAIQHRKLASKADAAQVKAFWTERFTALADVLARASRVRLRS